MDSDGVKLSPESTGYLLKFILLFVSDFGSHKETGKRMILAVQHIVLWLLVDVTKRAVPLTPALVTLSLWQASLSPSRQ